jgi:hypothetical protein
MGRKLISVITGDSSKTYNIRVQGKSTHDDYIGYIARVVITEAKRV